MDSDFLRVWKFDDAPAALKAGFGSSGHPQWLALVPRSIKGPDLDEAIRSHSELETLLTRETEAGDIVYVGSARVDVFMEAVSCALREGH